MPSSPLGPSWPSPPVSERRARACEATHPARAIAIYAPCIERLADGGSNGTYDEAAALVARMAAVRTAAEHEAFLAGLNLRYKRRRNLVARLP